MEYLFTKLLLANLSSILMALDGNFPIYLKQVWFYSKAEYTIHIKI